MMAATEDFSIADEEDPKWMSLDDNDFLSNRSQKLPPIKRGRAKLIMLEDILKDKKKKLKTGKKKNVKGAKKTQYDDDCSSDDDSSAEREEVAKFETVEEKLNKFSELIAKEERELVHWGERVFGPGKPSPVFAVPENDTGLLSRILKLNPQEGCGRSTVESMASNGLLLSWAALERRCDETTVRWLFHQMAYSDNWSVEMGACKILCDLLIRKTRDGSMVCQFEWLPNYEDIMDTFHMYGYLDAHDEELQSVEPMEKQADLPSQGEDTPADPIGNEGCDGPPSNMRSLLQFLVPYFRSRKRYGKLSTSEAESLVLLLIRCQLDRRLLNVSNLLGSCLETLVDSFKDEWTSSIEHIASAIARISPTFVNNLRVAKSFHATNNRFKSLQRLVVLQLLSRRVESQRVLSSPEDVVAIFRSVNLKDSSCNFLNLHDILVLADIYLWSDPTATRTRKVFSPWLLLLQKCSTQISIQDPRPHSMKVRYFASFLSQKYQVERMHMATTAQ